MFNAGVASRSSNRCVCDYAFIVCVVFLSLLGSRHVAAEVEVIVATTGPKADVGVAGDSIGFMYHFDVSPDGTWWGGHFELDDALDALHLRGQASSYTDVVWVEEQAAPDGLPGVLGSTAVDRQLSINDSGSMSGFVRFRETGINLGQFVYRYEGDTIVTVAVTDQTIPAIAGADYGFEFYSPNIDAGGAIAFYADNLTGGSITTANDAVTLYADGNVFAGQRKGVTTYGGEFLTRIDPGRFVVASEGDRFLFAGDTDGSTATDDIVVLGELGDAGMVALREGVTPITTSTGVEFFDVASQVLFGGGSWFVAGDTVDGTGVVLRDGEVIASEGDPAPNGFSYAGEPVALAADANGNYAWVWQTTNPDTERALVLVYNGSSVLIVEHDTLLYDVNADGTLDIVRIDRFFDDFFDLELGPDYAYFMTELDNPATTEFFGYGFLRVPVSEDTDADGFSDSEDNCIEIPNPNQLDSDGDGYGNRCDPDLNNDDIVNVVDLGLFRSVFFSADPNADFDGDGVVNVVDLGILRSYFFLPPGPSALRRR